MNGSGVSFRQTWDDRVEIAADTDARRAVYRFSPDLPKACMHPLVTPKGVMLSGFEMADHVWHRGLWFTIKFIDGANFWEEQSPFGVQASESQPTCECLASDTVRIAHHVNWTSQATGLAIRERRVMTFQSGKTHDCIDWSTELTPTKNLKLDRTPYTTWGGYGGLAFRASRELHDANFLLPNGETVNGLAGQSHDWVALQANVDGGVGRRVSMAMFDHPSNPRTPSPWYCKTGNGFTYMNPAFLFHEAMTITKFENLKLKYRVLYRDGVWTTDELASLASAFRATGGEQ